MKTNKLYWVMVVGIALSLAGSALAANRGSVQFSQEVMIAGTHVPAGEYNLSWEGSGSNVELKLMQSGKVVASTPAHMVDLKAPSVGNQTIVNKGAGGAASLSEIRLSGKKFAFQLGSESAGNSGGN